MRVKHDCKLAPQHNVHIMKYKPIMKLITLFSTSNTPQFSIDIEAANNLISYHKIQKSYIDKISRIIDRNNIQVQAIL